MMTHNARPKEYRAPPADPAGQFLALWVGGLTLVAIVMAVAAAESYAPGVWPIVVGWVAIMIVIVATLMVSAEQRARRAYAQTIWRMSDTWLDMRSPTEWVRIARHQVDTVAPAPDGIVVYAGERIIAIPDVVEEYDELRARLVEWMVPQTETPQQAAA